MRMTHLTGSNLKDADLTGADLEECDFESVTIERTILIDTNFKTAAENTDEEIMTDVFFSQKDIDDYKAKALLKRKQAAGRNEN